VEELLRHEGVVPGSARVCAQDTEINGTPIKQGTPVHVLIASANLDPEEFPDPDRVDFNRSGNRHLAFGGGVHRCLGSHLARLELVVALEEWHRRIPEYALAPGREPSYITGLRAVDELPLVFPRAN
jgi:cytochrome P450